MQRLIAYLIWTGFPTFLYRGVIELLVNRLVNRLPGAALLEEARHYGWIMGIVLALLTSRLLV